MTADLVERLSVMEYHEYLDVEGSLTHGVP